MMPVIKKPMQRDLFTGELAKKPKRGSGRHIKLRAEANETTRRVVPGMAHFPGTGPEGKYCRDCEYLQDIEYKRRGQKLVMHDACRKAMELLGRVQPGLISIQSSCRYFRQRAEPGGAGSPE
jgi:hypothetical protein